MATRLAPENQETLRSILSYHLVPRKIAAAESRPGELVTAQGGRLTLAGGSQGAVTVQGSRILQTDVQGGNGVIHVIGEVLLPSTSP